MTVEGNVALTCPDCSTSMIVMPSELFQAIGDLHGIEILKLTANVKSGVFPGTLTGHFFKMNAPRGFRGWRPVRACVSERIARQDSMTR